MSVDFRPINSTAYMPVVASSYHLFYDVEYRLEKSGVIDDQEIPYTIFFQTVEKVSREHYYVVDAQLSVEKNALRRS